MPDQAPTTPNPDPAKKKRQRGVLNKAQAEALTKGEQIGKTAQKIDHAAKLAVRDISAASVTQTLDKVKQARDKSAAALQSTTGKESATIAEDQSESELIIALQEVQTAAKQKYARTEPEKLKDFLVGKKLNESRALLEQYSQAIINKLDSDILPGITATKVTNLGTLRAAYIAANETQGDAQSDATSERDELSDLVQAVTDARITIQFAADAEYPYSNKANAAARKEFQLPANQPFNG